MKLALEHSCLKVNRIENAILFLRNALELEEEKSNLDNFQEGLVFTNEAGDHKIVVSECAEDSSNSKVLLLTNDCIQDYHRLKDKGINFTMTPDYTSEGLIAEFLDSFGNRYCLLEERNYKLS
jgi:predicted enzyme related to lactoylglutathione lyase